MSPSVWIGAVLAVLGGMFQGGFAVPMKYAKKWNHENIWSVFVMTGLVIFPWILTSLTIPSVFSVYRTAPIRSLILLGACGIGWGIGAVLVGIAFRMLGIGLGFALILGLSSLLGSLVPFLLGSSQSSSNFQLRLFALGGCIMVAGIAIVSAAGAIREKAEAGTIEHEGSQGKRFKAGLIIAIVAGVLSSLLSDGIAFTSHVVDLARQQGASPVWASNVVLAPMTTGGSIANLIYCAIMMKRNKSLSLFRAPSVGSHWIYGTSMGAFWYGGLVLYGLGEKSIGSVSGWPLFIGAMILSSSAAGFLTGEWRFAGRRAKLLLFGGSVLIFMALIIVGVANNE